MNAAEGKCHARLVKIAGDRLDLPGRVCNVEILQSREQEEIIYGRSKVLGYIWRPERRSNEGYDHYVIFVARAPSL